MYRMSVNKSIKGQFFKHLSNNLEEELRIKQLDARLLNSDFSSRLGNNSLSRNSLLELVSFSFFLCDSKITLSFSRIRVKNDSLEVESLRC
jgi:hypothetical protein